MAALLEQGPLSRSVMAANRTLQNSGSVRFSTDSAPEGSTVVPDLEITSTSTR